MADEPTPLPPAGWYPDPDQAQTQRYWTGQQWTDQRAPMSPAPERDRGAGALVVIGYITAFVIPIIGFILGIVLLVRRQTGHGIAVFLISIAVGVAACSIVLNETGEEIDRSLNNLQQETRAYEDCLERNNFRMRECRDLDPLN
jgi:hypothetical protein